MRRVYLSRDDFVGSATPAFSCTQATEAIAQFTGAELHAVLQTEVAAVRCRVGTLSRGNVPNEVTCEKRSSMS